MTSASVTVLQGQGDSERRCVVVDRDVRLDLRVAERTPGSGEWHVLEVSLQKTDGGSVTASGLRDLAFSRCFRKALDAVARETTAPTRTFARPSDPPAAFLADRRGSAPRSNRDFALLAKAYVSASTSDRRRTLPHEWSGRFGGSVRTWRNRLSEAKSWIGPDQELTQEALDLIYGDDLTRLLAEDNAIEEAERIAAERWRPGEVESMLRNGLTTADIAQRVARAKRFTRRPL